MAARSIGSGTISFGLVTIPIKLYSTNQPSSGISFNLLHGKCGSRLKQQYICPKDNEVVERSEMVKGYEVAKDQYVLFKEEELKALEQEASEAIEITEFVPAAQVDPLYFEKAYFLGPDKGAEKSYQLLGEAMRKTGRSALARYSARGKQYLVLLRPHAEGLVMQQLRYSDEVKPFSEVPEFKTSDLKEPELKLAMQLIEQIANDQFEPQKYTDATKQRMQEVIDKKVQGEQVTAAPAAAAPEGQIIDLMEALKQSLAQAGPEGRKPPKKAAQESAEPAAEAKKSRKRAAK